MKLIGAVLSVASAQSGCNWIWGNSGDRLECLPNFYVDGVCESGRRDDCGGLGTAVSFGIHCCPASRNIPIGILSDCGWVSGGTGEDIECPKSEAGVTQLAFGRCSTSARSDSRGACQDEDVHSVYCCSSESTVDEQYCGWLYETYGKNLLCPTNLVAAGFCGVNNTSDCKQGTRYSGIKCCPPEIVRAKFSTK
ncbi:Oidioi.mRNA.OKI2018_I69.chr2.g6545.t1.cds [Oikopleura dioica]|uniref:Oidioi.mRNA.OKI2018_I69.chr2.g6545.t1.cds n=1 Tax=Oikopleura dioica TaxID=34765 RepID=A0ABN7T783_OIKDI|nr:Oidioi.mRNA.OKI2018_I69.chr2.g6545.t1.cds [Oikopleura dioica]